MMRALPFWIFSLLLHKNGCWSDFDRGSNGYGTNRTNPCTPKWLVNGFVLPPKQQHTGTIGSDPKCEISQLGLNRLCVRDDGQLASGERPWHGAASIGENFKHDLRFNLHSWNYSLGCKYDWIVQSLCGGFHNRGTPSHHPFYSRILPYKPSSYWGTPILGNSQMGL